MKNPVDTLFAIRRLIVIFIIALLISGITAFWLEIELRFILDHFNFGNLINSWLRRVHAALEQTEQNHKFLIYGYDWLAFGHIIIALFFIEVYKRPVENRWVLKYGMIACFLILPTAFVAGYFRGIPIVWQLIDCSFGVFGFILLYRIYRQIESFRKSIDFTPKTHTIMDEIIFGFQIDGKTRCVHYCTEVDIVAIKMKCCGKFYSCIECHNELESHKAELWKRTEFNTNAILCGNCREELSINNYKSSKECPKCLHSFNEKCENHFPLYFES